METNSAAMWSFLGETLEAGTRGSQWEQMRTNWMLEVRTEATYTVLSNVEAASHTQPVKHKLVKTK